MLKFTGDFKQLKKFGFHKYDGEYVYGNYWAQYFSISTKDRLIYFYDEWYGHDFDKLDKLYDLIKAGLVEKVEG